MSTPRTALLPNDVLLANARWRKSSYSGGANDCVEIAELGAHVAVRDSKAIGLRPAVFSRAAVHALICGIVRGVI